MLILASTQRTVFWVIAALVLIGFVGYLIINVFSSGTAEIGSEIELAPNRKPYYNDEDMETKRLDISLAAGLGTLAIVALSLPLYWLGEPGRQDGRDEFTIAQFAGRGEGLYEELCAACHSVGGVGGVAPYTILDDAGRFVQSSDWTAPALTTVLHRFDVEELTNILQYGRPQSPMPAWGGLGGGPLTDQQLEEIIEYIKRIQLDSEEMQAEISAGIRADIVAGIRQDNRDIFAASTVAIDPDLPDDEKAAAEQSKADAIEQTYVVMNDLIPGLGDTVQAGAALGADASIDQIRANEAEVDTLLDAHFAGLSLEAQGELLFNNSGGNGQYNCARCHTAGSSWNANGVLADAPDYAGLIDPEIPGGGGLGPSLIGVTSQFPNEIAMEKFIAGGCELGLQYGLNGFCDSGQMPGFGAMLTAEQISAIVAYERGLE